MPRYPTPAGSCVPEGGPFGSVSLRPMHAFRFGAMTAPAEDRSAWLTQVRLVEELGFSTLFVSDHFSDKLAPLPSLVLAAEVSDLTVGTLVLGNDFRHPAVLAKEAATVDLLSEGRLELGLGTGWEESDYVRSGIERVRPGVQVDRLEESVAVLKGLWSEGPFVFDGEHYSVDMDGQPKPPGPTLLIGGGGRRMLTLAGREADIVGISGAGVSNRTELAGEVVKAADLMDQKLEWIRTGAGDRFDEIELHILIYEASVHADRQRGAAELATKWGSTPDQILESPHFLVGTHEEIRADIIERRERWGISYLAFPRPYWSMMAPVVEDLTGH